MHAGVMTTFRDRRAKLTLNRLHGLRDHCVYDSAESSGKAGEFGTVSAVPHGWPMSIAHEIAIEGPG
jgi:hypothetical protein